MFVAGRHFLYRMLEKLNIKPISIVCSSSEFLYGTPCLKIDNIGAIVPSSLSSLIFLKDIYDNEVNIHVQNPTTSRQRYLTKGENALELT